MENLIKNIQILEIEKQLTEKGIYFEFSAISETNGLSIYYTIDGEKCRFSDHSVTNIDRIRNEKHYKLPINNVYSRLNGFKKELRCIFTNEIISETKLNY